MNSILISDRTCLNTPNKLFRCLSWALIISCIFFLFTKNSEAKKPENISKQLQPLTLQLPWLHQFQFAGYYAAVEEGYYKNAGFNVEILEGKPGISPVNQVVSGQMSYGVARSELLLHRLNGKPIVVLAAIMQHSAIILLTKRGNGIESPHDMIGKRIMLLNGDDAAEYIAMFLNEGVPFERINRIPSSFDIHDLINGKVDVFNAYITNEPFILAQNNMPTTIIKPINYGIDFYGDCLFTSEHNVKTNPSQVQKFRTASLRGWEYALAHPEKIINTILTQYGSKKTKEHLLFEAASLTKLIMPELIEIGHMNPGRWDHMAKTYVDLKMTDPEYSLKGFIYDPSPKSFYKVIKWVLGVVATLMVVVSLFLILLLFHNKRLQAEVVQRKETEDSLRLAENRLRSLSEVAFEGIIFLDHGTIIEANPAATIMFGYSYAELMGMDILKLVSQADRKKVSDKIKSESVEPYESNGLRKDGTEFPLETHSKMYSFQNKPVRVTALRDLTEKKKAEEEIKTLRGVIPICSYCKEIRDDKGYWRQLEDYFSKHSKAEFSHSICPKCAKQLFPDMDLYDD